jgi:hypothetical protein
MIQPNDLLTPDQLAQKLSVARGWVTEKTRRRCSDRIPHMRIGKYIRFSWPAVAAWLESTSIPSTKRAPR